MKNLVLKALFAVSVAAILGTSPVAQAPSPVTSQDLLAGLKIRAAG
jgi:hypothetical protein